jgi:ubiquinone/menaquinone biosynthesis C-methylase UbiE
MELSVAKNLLSHGINRSLPIQHWADLGAGDGLFTLALAELLPSNSTIIALDKDQRSLQNITLKNLSVTLQTVVADLNKLPENFGPFDGIVMANSLHYIRDQNQFLQHLKTDVLNRNGKLILIEYDLDNGNAWVPYPISRKRLQRLSDEAGFDVQFLPNSVKSKLNSSEIYAAAMKPKA